MTFEYLPRLADKELATRLQRSGAVVIRGGKIDQTIMGPPSFLAVVHAGRYAARLDNGVFAIPLGCLGQ